MVSPNTDEEDFESVFLYFHLFDFCLKENLGVQHDA
jgi:hypothetical protein